ncbi:MAG: LysR family transcriptional regulator [Chthoniobacterales bacterium]
MFKIFADLADTQSFSKAAETNGITQSAVSQQIRAVEKNFQITLIERGRRDFALTNEGRAFLEASREILEIYESLGNRLQKMRDVVAGDLRISTVYSIGLHELPPYLKQFRRTYPEVEVKVEYRRSAQVYNAVLEGSADVGLVAYPSPRRGLDVLTFWKDKLVVICAPSHRFAHRRRLKLRDLDGEKFIAFEPDLPTRKEIDRRFKDEGVKVRHALEFDNIETVKRSVEIENGISIVPETAVQAEIRSGSLIAVEIDAENMWRPLGALIKKRLSGSHARKKFLDMLEKTNMGAVDSQSFPRKNS